MFVGHYGPSFAIKAVRPAVSLWLVFIAVQLVDVLWAILVLLGVEKVRIIPGITASNPLDLYYMPYTHSLIGAIFWSLAVAFVVWLLPRVATRSVAVWIGVAVFSHWILDFLVHRPDLPLYDDTLKIGLGLWNFPVVALSLEAALLFGGMILYLRVTAPINAIGRVGLPVFGVVMLAIQSYIFFGPPPVSPAAAAFTALGSYIVFAVLAEWLAHHRRQAADQRALQPAAETRR
jgi:membrane-bound metal-dependent hydrolase YbcI (DUF457 family)